MQDAQAIVLATPVFLLLIALEALMGWRRGRITDAWSDTLNSIGLGMMSQAIGVFTKLSNAGHLPMGLRACGAVAAERPLAGGLDRRAAGL